MNTEITRLSVAGMSCSSCVYHVGEALKDLDGVQDVDVRLTEGEVRVLHRPEDTSVETLISTLAEAGYEATVA